MNTKSGSQKMNKTQVKQRIEELEKKYFDLVWYARHNPNEILGIKKAAEIKNFLKEEVSKLHGANSNFHHGFNSGCLAAFRLISGLLSNDKNAQLAEDSFPFLDT